MFFASDNTAPVPPAIMAALAKANEGYAMPYGNDPLTAAAVAALRQVFEAPEAAVYFVGTGTAANALALACLCPPWGAVYGHEDAHIAQDECGAPEFFSGGAKLIGLAGAHGKIAPEALEAALAAAESVGVHNVQKAALSLSCTTESGTIYRPAEVAALCQVAKAHGLAVHLDGARLANALAALNCAPADLTWRAGVDVLSFGGTKNGLLGVEAVVIFDPAKAWEFELRRKRAGHLFSKHRYLAAQMLAYLEDGLWLRLAAQANAMAGRLAAGITALPGAHLVHPVEANAVFAAWPRAGHQRAQKAGARYYLWPGHQSLEGPGAEPLSARLVASWSTSEAEVEAFLALLRDGA